MANLLLTITCSIMVLATAETQNIAYDYIDFTYTPYYIDYSKVPSVNDYLYDEFIHFNDDKNKKLNQLIETELLYENESSKVFLVSYCMNHLQSLIKINKNISDIINKRYETIRLSCSSPDIEFNPSNNTILCISRSREGCFARGQIALYNLNTFKQIETDSTDYINCLRLPILPVRGNKWVDDHRIMLEIPVVESTEYKAIAQWVENPHSKTKKVYIDLSN